MSSSISSCIRNHHPKNKNKNKNSSSSSGGSSSAKNAGRAPLLLWWLILFVVVSTTFLIALSRQFNSSGIGDGIVDIYYYKGRTSGSGSSSIDSTIATKEATADIAKKEENDDYTEESLPSSSSPSFTIVCQLSGELGNQLSHLAHCRSIQLWLLQHERYKINTHIILRHQTNNDKKWLSSRDDILECFPRFRNSHNATPPSNVYDFNDGPANNLQYFMKRSKQQSRLLDDEYGGAGSVTGRNRGEENNDDDDYYSDGSDESDEYNYYDPKAKIKPHVLLNGINVKDDPLAVTKTLDVFKNMTKRKFMYNNNINNNNNEDDEEEDQRITIPFLYANMISQTDIFVDTHYEQIRNYLLFDYDSCCKIIPEPDETVFHFRNFAEEGPIMSKKIGTVELDPQQAASELFGHLNEGDKVAIITRYDASTAQPYVDALEQRGLQVRVIQGQSGNEDFCFLMNAKKEMIGIAYSTYLFWAGVLSNTCQRVVAYSINTQARKESGRTVYVKYNWTNTELQKKFQFQLIHPWNNVSLSTDDMTTPKKLRKRLRPGQRQRKRTHTRD